MNDRKEDIRNEIRALRKKLNAEEKTQMDQKILSRLFALPDIKQAELVYVYASIAGEADTWGLIHALWINHISVALPRIEGECLRFYIVDNLDSLVPGLFGILEPGKHCEPALGITSPVVTPGLAFSRNGDRLGYGGGYYDRFFVNEPEHRRIGLAYPFQILQNVSPMQYDQKIHCIVTPEETICTG